jgi:hypothetical protein
MLEFKVMMPKPLANSCDADRQPVAEPTKYIVRCCELRKRRELRPSLLSGRQRIHVSLES